MFKEASRRAGEQASRRVAVIVNHRGQVKGRGAGGGVCRGCRGCKGCSELVLFPGVLVGKPQISISKPTVHSNSCSENLSSYDSYEANPTTYRQNSPNMYPASCLNIPTEMWHRSAVVSMRLSAIPLTFQVAQHSSSVLNCCNVTNLETWTRIVEVLCV